MVEKRSLPACSEPKRAIRQYLGTQVRPGQVSTAAATCEPESTFESARREDLLCASMVAGAHFIFSSGGSHQLAPRDHHCLRLCSYLHGWPIRPDIYAPPLHYRIFGCREPLPGNWCAYPTCSHRPHMWPGETEQGSAPTISLTAASANVPRVIQARLVRRSGHHCPDGSCARQTETSAVNSCDPDAHFHMPHPDITSSFRVEGLRICVLRRYEHGSASGSTSGRILLLIRAQTSSAA